MAREKGMGNLQREKSGRWTMRVGINGKRYCRSTRTKEELKRLLEAAKSVPSASRRPALVGGGTVTAPVAEDGDGTVANAAPGFSFFSATYR